MSNTETNPSYLSEDELDNLNQVSDRELDINSNLEDSFSSEPIDRTEGFHTNVFPKFRNHFKNILNLEEDNNNCLLNIDDGFVFDGNEIVDDFKWQDVEPLVEQAASLLDRAINDKDEYNVLNVEAFKLCLEIFEFEQLDKIHEREEEEGYYELSYKTSNFELKSERAMFSSFKNSNDKLNWLINTFFNPEASNKYLAAIQLERWLNGYPDPGQLFTFNGINLSKADHLKKVGDILSVFDFNNQSARLQSQTQSIYGQYVSSYNKSLGIELKNDWNKKDIEFKKERTSVARKLAIQKALAAITPGGELNYPERMKPIKERWNSDFNEAYARLIKVAEGMRKLYGYNKELPEPIFDKCINWTRDVTNWLSRFSRLSQNYVLPISVKKILGEEGFLAALTNGKLEFDISENLFPSQSCVRIRGISVNVNETDNGLWQVTVRAPSESRVYTLNSTNSDLLDQTNLPPVRIGRVGRRDDRRNADVVGLSALFNASPLGRWSIEIDNYSLTGESRTTLTDLQIDIHVAIRSSF